MILYFSVTAALCRYEPAAIAQSVVRRIGSAEVTGPIPVSSFFLRSVGDDFIFYTPLFVFILY